MKRVIIGVFAHPDDEAFGPSGTLLRLRDSGYDIHLILLTDGEAGTNPGVSDFGAVRQQEWQTAANSIGAASTCRLNLGDGKVADVPPEQLDDQLKAEVHTIMAMYDQPVQLSLMTFEPRGITGHRDHIAASEATLRLFEVATLNTFAPGTAYKLWYFCLSKEQAPLNDTPYYHAQACPDSFITDRIDVSSVLARKYAVIDCHVSQIADATNVKKLGDEKLSTECFHVVTSGLTDQEF